MAEVGTQWLKHEGVTGVQLAVAKPLSDSALAKLKREFKSALGNEVELTVSLKPHLLAGLVATVGDQRYDASLKGRIDNLYHALAGSEQ
jgi:F-type H+-transporting ATPase subunit delta